MMSMTGYGKGQYADGGRKFTIEIKSVNNRYSDISIKLPRILNPLEDQIRKKLSAVVSRGKTDVYVGFESDSEKDVSISLNQSIASAYFSQLEKISAAYSLTPDHSKMLELIARFPDVIDIDKSMTGTAADELWSPLAIAIEEAVDQFLTMRKNEGAALKADLLKKLASISAIAAEISLSIPQIQETQRRKLAARMEEVLKDIAVDETRLLTEAAYQAERSAIDEELTRLESHIAQFHEIMEEPNCGKKLDFLIQELMRETNTIGSKSNDIGISRKVIQLKSEIEKMREQVQNIE